MKEFVRHDPCPKCNSSDNVAVYYNDDLGGETYSCMTPGCDYAKTDAELAKELGKKYEQEVDSSWETHHDLYSLPATCKYIDRPVRGIPRKEFEKYRAQYNPDDRLMYFPYFQGHFMIAAKSKSSKKEVKWHGPKEGIRRVNFFGENVTANAAKSQWLILTEGEEDAIAAHYLNGNKAWSVPHGAKSAEKYVRANLPRLEQFKRVYICFDNDEDGQLAAEACMKALAPGVGYWMLPRYKDACEYLAQASTYDIARAQFNTDLRNAQPLPSEYVWGDEEFEDKLQELAFDTDKLSGSDTGIRQLNSILGGWRAQEVTTIVGDTSVGKSSLARYLAALQLLRGKTVCIASLEESVMISVMKILGMLIDKPLVVPGHGFPLKPERLRSLWRQYKDYIAPCKFSGRLDIDALAEAIQYAVRSKQAEYVIVDNVTMGISEVDDPNRGMVKLMSRLNRYAEDYNCHIWALSHVSKANRTSSNKSKPPELIEALGSHTISAFAHNVITVGRNIETEDFLNIAIRKHRTSGECGQFRLNWDTTKATFYEEDYARAKREHNGGDPVRQHGGDGGISVMPPVGEAPVKDGDRTHIHSPTDHEVQPGLHTKGAGRKVPADRIQEPSANDSLDENDPSIGKGSTRKSKRIENPDRKGQTIRQEDEADPWSILDQIGD